MSKKRRRFVAPPTRLGASEEGDLTALAPARPASRPAKSSDEPALEPGPGPVRTSQATGPVLPDRAQGDSDEAWGDSPEGDSHLLREKPPHWQ